MNVPASWKDEGALTPGAGASKRALLVQRMTTPIKGAYRATAHMLIIGHRCETIQERKVPEYDFAIPKSRESDLGAPAKRP